MPIKLTPVQLTKAEWEEIAAAVQSKIWLIQKGEYGPEDEPGQDADWLRDLVSIQNKIGIDGLRAVKRGVDPCRVNPRWDKRIEAP